MSSEPNPGEFIEYDIPHFFTCITGTMEHLTGLRFGIQVGTASELQCWIDAEHEFDRLKALQYDLRESLAMIQVVIDNAALSQARRAINERH